MDVFYSNRHAVVLVCVVWELWCCRRMWVGVLLHLTEISVSLLAFISDGSALSVGNLWSTSTTQPARSECGAGNPYQRDRGHGLCGLHEESMAWSTLPMSH